VTRRRNRWLLRIAVVLVAGGAMLFWALRQKPPPLTVSNKSGQAIAKMRISFGDETSTFTNVARSEEISVPVVGKSDTPFSVDINLADGNLIRSSGRWQQPIKVIVLPDNRIEIHPADKE
jgi:hypothetical protein